MITEFPLFLFTLFGGTAAGAYVFLWAFPATKSKKRLAVPLVALILLAIGGIALLLHLGHPERMFNAFANSSAGITREAVTTGLFGVLVLVDLIVALRSDKPAPKALNVLAAIAGVLLLLAMGFAYSVLKGVPAWSNWATVPLFVVGGLSAGICMLPLFDAAIVRNGGFALCAAALNVLFACIAIAVGMHFSSVGFSMMPFICAAVVAVVTAVVAYLAKSRNGSAFAVLAFVLAIASVAIARYAFYMVV